MEALHDLLEQSCTEKIKKNGAEHLKSFESNNIKFVFEIYFA